jgi:UDP-N-acetylglucosamine diphosphorylase/glucosamine-1-phosphate N-acetyltransferase
MSKIILFDNEVRDQLLPLTYTRPVCELRIGILTIKEKWERWLNMEVAYITQDYLAEKYPIDQSGVNYIINGSVLPSPQLVHLIKQMDFNEAFLRGEELIVAKLEEGQIENLVNDEDIGELKGYDLAETEYLKIDHLYDIFRLNDQALRADFELITKGRRSQPLSSTNQLIGPKDQLFIEEGAIVEASSINTKNGPVYIGPSAEVMEGCMIRGGLALCDNAKLKLGTKIYGPTTIGPYSKIGGEVNNSVITGYSNKGHDGFLGNSVLGEWCNIGADTNISNLKNNYDEVKLWNYPAGRFLKTGQQFCGLVMGDHSKTGINTMLNTGTVIGVSCNIFGEGFPRNFIPSFSWGGKHGYQTYHTNKAFDTAERVMARRQKEFSVEERLILLRVFEETARYRSWDKD